MPPPLSREWSNVVIAIHVLARESQSLAVAAKVGWAGGAVSLGVTFIRHGLSAASALAIGDNGVIAAP